MTVFHFTRILVWGNLGSSPQFARGVRSQTLVDPLTDLLPAGLTQGGVAVGFVVSDDAGQVTFEAGVDVVRANFGAGPQTLYSDERLTATADAAPGLAAAAAAQDAIDEVTTGTGAARMVDAAKVPAGFVKTTGNQTIEGLIDFAMNPLVGGSPIGGGLVQDPPGSGLFVGTIQVLPPSAPVFTSSSPPNAILGQPYSYQFMASGSPTFTVSTGNPGGIPTGMTFTSGGLLSGTPTVLGVATFTVTATNALGSATDSSTVTVAAAGAAPEFTAWFPPGATVGSVYAYQFTATGSPAPTFTISEGLIPFGTTLSPSGILSGVPNTPGTVSFTVRAANGVSPDSLAACTIVTAEIVGTAPVFTAALPPGGTVGTAYSYQFAASGTTPITFTVSAGTLPAGLSLSTGGLLSGTPTTVATSLFTLTAANGISPNAVSAEKSVAVVASGGGGSPAWVGYSAGSILTGWASEQQLMRSAQQAIVSSPARAGFSYAARFITAPGDYTNGGTSAERSEVYTSNADAGNPSSGQTMWWGYSIYFPSDFANNSWFICTQWHANDGASPVVVMGMTNHSPPRLIISTHGDDGAREWIMSSSFPRGQWVDMRVGIVWGATASTGRLTVRQDGATLLNNVACGNMHGSLNGYFKQGIYRGAQSLTQTVYYTGTRRATTEANVTL